jgi:hypothetical protein
MIRLNKHSCQRNLRRNGRTIVKRYLLSAVVAATLLTCTTLSVAGDVISIDYQYSGATGVSLSSVSGGPLTVSTFTDGRSDSEASAVQRPGKEPLILENLTAAALLQSTFAGAFEASGAKLGDAGSPIVLDGKIVEMQVSDTANGLETLIRVELSLRNQGRNAWRSVVFSRVASEGSDAESAIELGLNRLVAELFRDDYFLMALGIF